MNVIETDPHFLLNTPRVVQTARKCLQYLVGRIVDVYVDSYIHADFKAGGNGGPSIDSTLSRYIHSENELSASLVILLATDESFQELWEIVADIHGPLDREQPCTPGTAKFPDSFAEEDLWLTAHEAFRNALEGELARRGITTGNRKEVFQQRVADIAPDDPKRKAIWNELMTPVEVAAS